MNEVEYFAIGIFHISHSAHTLSARSLRVLDREQWGIGTPTRRTSENVSYGDSRITGSPRLRLSGVPAESSWEESHEPRQRVRRCRRAGGGRDWMQRVNRADWRNRHTGFGRHGRDEHVFAAGARNMRLWWFRVHVFQRDNLCVQRSPWAKRHRWNLGHCDRVGSGCGPCVPGWRYQVRDGRRIDVRVQCSRR